MAFIEVYQPRLREMPDILTDDIRPGRQYEVVAGTVVYDGSSYDIGDKFYGITSSGTEYSGGSVKQVGAFIKATPGHLGKAAILPHGLFFDPEASEAEIGRASCRERVCQYV